MVTSAARPEPRATAVLNGWKEIAVYLGRGVRTVQRWHSELHLSVHKVRAAARSPVFEYKSELDLWMRQNALRDLGNSSHTVAPDCRHVSSAAERAMSSAGKMSLLISRQHDQLNRLAEQVNHLASIRKNTPNKVE